MKWFRISVSCMKKIFKILMFVMICSVLLCTIYMSEWWNFVGRKYDNVTRVERVGDNQSTTTEPVFFMPLARDIPYEESMMSKEVMQTPKDEVQGPTGVMQSLKDVMQTAKKEVRVLKGVMQTPKKKVQTPKVVMQSPKEEVRTPKDMIESPKMGVQTPKRNSTVADTVAEIYENISEFFHLSNSDQQDPLLNLHRFNYLINSGKCQQNIFVLIFVHSSSGKWPQRNQIRTTWGGYQGSKGKYFRTVFMLGKPVQRTLQPAIVQEALKYNDMVQGDFYDTYTNLTYKHIMAHSWVTENCQDVSYIVKVDDDIMVNVYNMVKYFNTIKSVNNNSIYCYAFRYEEPHRNSKSKWAISKSEYPFTKYPQFCEGFAYITTPQVAAKLVKMSRNTKFFWIDDVFVTGILTLRAKVPLTSMAVNHGHDSMQKLYTGPLVKNVMFIVVRTASTRQYWGGTWQAILNYSRY